MSDISEMKTLYLSIITGTGIASVISFALIVVIMPSSLADQAGLTIGVEQNEVGIGEPISFFVEISSPLQSSVHPTAVIVDEQNRTVWSDDDLPPNGYKGMTKVYYVQRDSENVPVINQTGKYTLIVTFADKKASKDLTVTGTIQENNMLHYYGAYTGIDKENTDIEIVDKSYYLTTVHKTPSDLTAPNDTTIQFHGVTFTFPGCGQCLPMPTVSNPSYNVNVQFNDKTNETLEIRDNQWSTIGPPMDFHEYLANGTKIFPNGTRGTWTPRFHMDPIVTVFSNHEHPQAGITVTHDSVKFLVSVENNSSQQYAQLGNTENSTLSENQSKVSQLGNHWYGGGGPMVTIILDPLQQFKSGIALKDITCAPDFHLVIKAKNRSPACVKPDDVSKLVERGWADKPNSLQEEIDFANVCLGMNDACNHRYDVKNSDPFGITALIIYHPPDLCLNPTSHSSPASMPSCPPNNFYLKINSNSTAYLLGYNVCDGESCTKSNDLSVLLPINVISKPDYQMIGLPVDLQWKYGDIVHIQLEVSSTTNNETGLLVDLGNSTIVP